MLLNIDRAIKSWYKHGTRAGISWLCILGLFSTQDGFSGDNNKRLKEGEQHVM